jgi:hypothetical protein
LIFLGSFCTIEFHNIFFYLDVNKLYIFSSKPFYIICLINFMKKIHFRHLHKSYIKYLRRYVSIKTKWIKRMKSNLNVIRNNHDYRVKMNVIDYITITCNLKNGRLQITSDFMKKCNRLQRLQLQITITPCLTVCIIILFALRNKLWLASVSVAYLDSMWTIYDRLRSASTSHIVIISNLWVFSNQHPLQILRPMADLLVIVRAYVSDVNLGKWETAIDLKTECQF